MFRLSIRTGLVLGSQNSITSTLSAMTFSVGSNESEFACVVKVFPSRAYEPFTLCKALRRLGRRTGFGPRLYGPLTEQFPGFDKRFVCFPQRQFVAPLCVSPTNSLCDVRYPSEVLVLFSHGWLVSNPWLFIAILVFCLQHFRVFDIDVRVSVPDIVMSMKFLPQCFASP